MDGVEYLVRAALEQARSALRMAEDIRVAPHIAELLRPVVAALEEDVRAHDELNMKQEKFLRALAKKHGVA